MVDRPFISKGMLESSRERYGKEGSLWTDNKRHWLASDSSVTLLGVWRWSSRVVSLGVVCHTTECVRLVSDEWLMSIDRSDRPLYLHICIFWSPLSSLKYYTNPQTRSLTPFMLHYFGFYFFHFSFSTHIIIFTTPYTTVIMQVSREFCALFQIWWLFVIWFRSMNLF